MCFPESEKKCGRDLLLWLSPIEEKKEDGTGGEGISWKLCTHCTVYWDTSSLSNDSKVRTCAKCQIPKQKTSYVLLRTREAQIKQA